MKRSFTTFLALAILFFAVTEISAQTNNDGPIELSIKLRDINVTYSPSADANLNIGGGGVGFSPDEMTFKVWARDNPNLSGLAWQGGTCLRDNFDPPISSKDFDTMLFTFTYPVNVPSTFDLRLDAWQDNCGSDGVNLGIFSINCGGNRCTFETQCTDAICGGTASVGDNRRCNADPFATGINYRTAGPPCRWNDHGYITTTNCPSNNFYQLRINSQWRYLKGTACTPTDALDLGTLSPGGTALTHFNSNECYGNNFAASPGNDVFYKFTTTAPIGVTISVCGTTTNFDTYVYLLDNNCTIQDQDDDGCNVNQSVIHRSLCRAGDYYIVVDGKLASSMGTFTLNVSENTSFTFGASIDVTNPGCAGESTGAAEVNVTGGVPPFSYQWSRNSVNDTIVTGLIAGTIEVTVTDAINCTVTATANLVDPQPISVQVLTTPVSCGGQSDGTAGALPTGGTPPYDYLWSTFPIQQTGQTAVSLTAGTYTVTVEDFRGCTVSGSGDVIAGTNFTLDIDTVQHVTCHGDNDGLINITITGGVTPVTATWSRGTTVAEDVRDLSPGMITLTVQDGAGCIDNRSFEIREPAVLEASVHGQYDVACFGGSTGAVFLEVIGGVSPYAYSWTGGNTSADFLNAPAGPFSVTVTDANGCNATDSGTLTEPSAPLTVTVSKTDSDCVGDNIGTATATATGGTGNYTYLWSNLETTAAISGLGGGSLFVLVTDANGCTATETVTIIEAGEINVEANTVSPCSGRDNGRISLSVTGTGPFTFTWSGTTSAGDTATSLEAGTYTVTVSDPQGCEVVRTFTLVNLSEDDCASFTGDYVVIPNAFSPNGDGINDYFDIHSQGTLNIAVKIFDRWGTLVWEKDNQQPNTIGQGWDGRSRGKDAQSGSYVYVMDIEFENQNTNEPRQRTGTITVIR